MPERGDINFTKKQKAIYEYLCRTGKKKICLYGGRRSGKTMLFIALIIRRAMMAPCSKHFIYRKTLKSAKNTLWRNTFEEFKNFKSYKDFFKNAHIDNQSLRITFHNRSVIQVFGLNDAQQQQRGDQCNTLYFNECSEIDYEDIMFLQTSLAQSTPIDYSYFGYKNPDKPDFLKNITLMDFNPKYKTHWDYQYLFLYKNPITGQYLSRDAKEDMFVCKLNTIDNLVNINQDYIDNAKKTLSEAQFKNEIEGEFLEENQGAVFSYNLLKRAENDNYNYLPFANLRLLLEDVIISVDPAITSNKSSDMVGIIVLGYAKGLFFVLDDKSGIYSPTDWADIVLRLYEIWTATAIIVETNQGGDENETIIRQQDEIRQRHVYPHIIGKQITRVDGDKITRARAIVGLYENDKVVHVNFIGNSVEPSLDKLCFEMLEYTGDKKQKSPNRLDALTQGLRLLRDMYVKNKTNVMTNCYIDNDCCVL